MLASRDSDMVWADIRKQGPMSVATQRGEAYWPVRSDGEKEALREACSSGTEESWTELRGGPKAVSDGP